MSKGETNLDTGLYAAALVDLESILTARDFQSIARVHDRRADIVDQLFADQLLAVPDRIKDLAHGERRRRVLSNQTERFLTLGRRRVLDPE